MIINFYNVIITSMVRIALCLFIFITCSLSCLAESFEATLTKEPKILAYVYTNECKYCVSFNPIYEKIVKNYNSKLKIVKKNAKTAEGYYIMKKFNGVFVPFVIMIDNKNKQIYSVHPNCLLNYACMSNAVDVFIHK